LILCSRSYKKIAYDWKSLPASSLVFDVGGGVGTACLALAKGFPKLKFVVQDRQPAVEAGVEVHIPYGLWFLTAL
jgi:hypothetical protein